MDVSVIINLNEEGQATDSLSPGFSYVNGGGGGILQPTVFSVTPSSGPNEGGTQVTINGDGFEAPVAVDFGDVGNEVAAQVVSVSRTRIVVSESVRDRNRLGEPQPARGRPGDEPELRPARRAPRARSGTVRRW